jgi:hypothetical protein
VDRSVHISVTPFLRFAPWGKIVQIPWIEREVHAVAALTHPNICNTCDVGPNYLVMELVEGIAKKGVIVD